MNLGASYAVKKGKENILMHKCVCVPVYIYIYIYIHQTPPLNAKCYLHKVSFHKENGWLDFPS